MPRVILENCSSHEQVWYNLQKNKNINQQWGIISEDGKNTLKQHSVFPEMDLLRSSSQGQTVMHYKTQLAY